jgi:hypothetical protein
MRAAASCLIESMKYVVVVVVVVVVRVRHVFVVVEWCF